MENRPDIQRFREKQTRAQRTRGLIEIIFKALVLWDSGQFFVSIF